MKLVRAMVCGSAGLLAGGCGGFCVALTVASLSPPRNDGTFGMREMLVWLPVGAFLGGLLGVVLALRR